MSDNVLLAVICAVLIAIGGVGGWWLRGFGLALRECEAACAPANSYVAQSGTCYCAATGVK